MLAFPTTKINLGLYLTEKRSDNFHSILSCFYPVQWSDVLEIVPSETFEFLQTGLQVPGNPEDNLCVKAYNLLKNDFDLPNVRIHLHKIIPMGAGLGGGSSDAAFVLKTLNNSLKLGIGREKLMEYAAVLGSDCAFFIPNKTSIATGRGEILEDFKIDLSGTKIVIVYPDIHISTAEAFADVKPKTFEGDFKALLAEPEKWKDQLRNQFEETIFLKYPLLDEIKQQLYKSGAFYASMSGSGSSIYGLFKGEIEELDLNYKIFMGTF